MTHDTRRAKHPDMAPDLDADTHAAHGPGAGAGPTVAVAQCGGPVAAALAPRSGTGVPAREKTAGRVGAAAVRKGKFQR